MFHVEHYLFIFDFIINYISFFSPYNYFPGNISMFHVEHYLFISVLIINYISFFSLYNYFPGNISMFHVKHYLFISVLIINYIPFFSLYPFTFSLLHCDFIRVATDTQQVKTPGSGIGESAFRLDFVEQLP